MKEAAKAAIYGPTFSNGGCSLPTIKDADFKSALEKISPSGSRLVLLVFHFTFFFTERRLTSQYFWVQQHKNCELFAEKDENDEFAAFEAANE